MRWRDGGAGPVAPAGGGSECAPPEPASVARSMCRCIWLPRAATMASTSPPPTPSYGSGDVLHRHAHRARWRAAASAPLRPADGACRECTRRSPGTGVGRSRPTPTASWGAAVGVYSGTVDEQYVPYIFPQENGNKTDVRWAALTAKDGSGLLVVGERAAQRQRHSLHDP